MLRWRLLLGAIIIGAIVALCWLDFRAAQPGTWLFPIAILLTLGASQEAISLLDAKSLSPAKAVVYLGNLAIVLSAFLPHLCCEQAIDGRYDGYIVIAFALTVLAAFAAEMRRYEAPGESMMRVSLTIFCLAYVGVLMAVIVKLRHLAPGSAGLIPLILLIAAVKLGDIGAYTVGRLVGRHKLAPVLSPGKTIEGAAGALAFASLGAIAVLKGLYPYWAPDAPAISLWKCIGAGVAIGVAGMIGDLAESLFKRDMGRKDSSTWMPGFGGVLDILDSLLIAAPVVYLVCRNLLPTA